MVCCGILFYTRMFNLFQPKGKLGIDIGSSAVKIVELTKAGGRFNLVNYGSFSLKGVASDPTGSQDLLKLPDEEIVWGIKEIIKQSKMKATEVVASIPAFSTFATVIEMPYLSEEDLAKAIPFEARKYVPIPLDEVVLDWSIVGILDSKQAVAGPAPRNHAAPATTVEIFLAAVPKDETARYQRIMQAAGLKLTALELENAALTRGLLGNDLSPMAIVNIGGRSTSIVIVNKGFERVSRNYEVAGFEITKSIARSLNITLEKAEDLKRKLGVTDSPENIAKDAMLPLIDMMIFETKKIITGYEESKNTKISRVVLVGGLVSMPNFVNYFKQRVGREVFVGNAFARVIHPPELTPVVQELSNNFSVAIGLAMREV